MILFQLFYAFVRVGLFAFGGGYAVLALIQKIIVGEMQWLTYAEFNEVVAISQMTPGPIAVNAATYVGYRVAGVPGATVATLSVCLPSILLVIIITHILKRFETNVVVIRFLTGLRPAVIALIATAAYSIAVTGKGIVDIKGIIIALVSFAIIRTKKLDPVLVLILAGIAGVIAYY